MNQIETAWVAGLLEGEGSFVIKGGRYARISCAMTDLDILERLKNITGIGNICSVSRQQAHHKDAWVWSIGGPKAYNLMVDLLPMMGERRSAAIKLAMEAQNLHMEKLEKIHLDWRAKVRVVQEEYARGGWSERSLAKVYGVSHVTIHNWLKVK